MLEKNPRAVDITKEEARKQLLPRSPILSSHDTGWENICVEQYCQPAFETPKVCHQQYMITIHTGAPIRLRQVEDGQTQTVWVREGDIFLAPPGFCRQCRWDRESEFISLFLEPELITRAAIELGHGERVEILPRFKERDRLIEGIGLSLKMELELNRLGSCSYADSLASTLAFHLLCRYAVQSPVGNSNGEASRRKLQRAVSYINDHLAEELSLELIANQVGISQYHFARLFKQFTGVAPHQYVIRCRIERAKQLLSHSDMSIKDIAASVGFTDASHLSRVFRQLTGMTPKSYRER